MKVIDLYNDFKGTIIVKDNHFVGKLNMGNIARYSTYRISGFTILSPNKIVLNIYEERGKDVN